MVFVREPDFERQRFRMVRRLASDRIIRSEDVARAMEMVPREEFVHYERKAEAYVDKPLPLGRTGQTISAPHMVAIMLEECDLRSGQKVLEIGAGSGYNAALMAEIVSSSTRKPEKLIVAVERIPELVELAKDNLRRTGYLNRVDIFLADGTLGYPERCEEPFYDRIIVSASGPSIPPFLELQLEENGIMLMPVGDLFHQTLIKGVKRGGTLEKFLKCECVFVPLVGAHGY